MRGRDLATVATKGKRRVANGDCIVTGEIPGASNADLDFEGYRQMTRDFEGQERLPNYAILTTSRGCPFDCSYCAQKAYNEGSLKVRFRSPVDTFKEIRDKYHNYGIHHFGFYEDNFLLEKPNQRDLRLFDDCGLLVHHQQVHANPYTRVLIRFDESDIDGRRTPQNAPFPERCRYVRAVQPSRIQ